MNALQVILLQRCKCFGSKSGKKCSNKCVLCTEIFKKSCFFSVWLHEFTHFFWFYRTVRYILCVLLVRRLQQLDTDRPLIYCIMLWLCCIFVAYVFTHSWLKSEKICLNVFRNIFQREGPILLLLVLYFIS